jgi:hypothetical protein
LASRFIQALGADRDQSLHAARFRKLKRAFEVCFGSGRVLRIFSTRNFTEQASCVGLLRRLSALLCERPRAVACWARFPKAASREQGAGFG